MQDSKKIVLITGASRGIGLACARAFAKAGYDMYLTCLHSEARLSALKQELETQWHISCRVCLCDAGNHRDVARLFSSIDTLDVLINNAGISDRQPFLDYDLERFDRIMRLNVTAPYVCSQAAAVIMKDQGHGVILNTSSMVGTYGQPAGVAYPVSKWAVNGMTKSLARELGPFNIRVNAVAPGVTATDMVRALPEEMVERISQGIPLRRVGKPSDIAHAFLFLASDEAGYITGAILPVDGATQV